MKQRIIFNEPEIITLEGREGARAYWRFIEKEGSEETEILLPVPSQVDYHESDYQECGKNSLQKQRRYFSLVLAGVIFLMLLQALLRAIY